MNENNLSSWIKIGPSTIIFLFHLRGNFCCTKGQPEYILFLLKPVKTYKSYTLYGLMLEVLYILLQLQKVKCIAWQEKVLLHD